MPLGDQRRAVGLWHAKINQFGPCIEGIANLSNLIFGSGSLISGTLSDPSSNAIAGKTVTLNISDYANTAFTYGASNSIGFNSSRKQYYLEGTTSQLSSDLQFMTHQNLYVLNRSLITDPIIINNHISEITGIRLYFNDSKINDLPLEGGISKICILDEAKSRKLSAFVSKVKALVPSWVTVIYA